MIALSFVWLGLLILDFTASYFVGQDREQQTAGAQVRAPEIRALRDEIASLRAQLAELHPELGVQAGRERARGDLASRDD
jgi:hypothetical protein